MARIGADGDLILVRQQVRECAESTGMTLVEQTKVITAASELARNTLIHGGGGHVEIARVRRDNRQGVRLAFIDHGPGIADVHRALVDGHSTGSGLGLGLGGARRLVHEFTLESTPGKGTRVTIASWARTPLTDEGPRSGPRSKP